MKSSPDEILGQLFVTRIGLVVGDQLQLWKTNPVFLLNYEESWHSMDTWVAEFPDGVNSIEQLCRREAIEWQTIEEHVMKEWALDIELVLI